MAVITKTVVFLGALSFLGAVAGGAASGATSELTRSRLEQSRNTINNNAQQFQQCCSNITVQINNITNIHWEGDNSGIMNNQWISNQRPALDEMFDSQMAICADILATIMEFDRTAQNIKASEGNISRAGR